MEAIIWGSMIIGIPPLAGGIYLLLKMRSNVLESQRINDGPYAEKADIENRVNVLEETVRELKRSIGGEG